MHPQFVTKNGKRLRRGYTTGTCAAAASKAAALYLLTSVQPKAVTLTVPAGEILTLDVACIERNENIATCAVQKDAGDDPDVTHDTWVYAAVSKAAKGITIDGGEGVGRVTKPGLDQPVGAAAINSTPRRMIGEAVQEIADQQGYIGGFLVIISIPAGKELASRTFNPRLGIVGGISVIGTTGIVEPMSDEAVIETIRVELNMRKATGKKYVVFTPGNYGEAFFKEHFHPPEKAVIQCGNFIGDGFRLAKEMGFSGALLVGHLGKLVKLAGGMMNTHSRYGDCRMELLVAHAATAGLTAAKARSVLAAATVDEALRVLKEAGILEETMPSLMKAIQGQLSTRYPGIEIAVATFTNGHGLLKQTANAPALIVLTMEEENA